MKTEGRGEGREGWKGGREGGSSLASQPYIFHARKKMPMRMCMCGKYSSLARLGRERDKPGGLPVDHESSTESNNES